MRTKNTLRLYGLTETTFAALYESQNGCCAICGISEPELEAKYSAPEYWASERMLHIDHEHGSSPCRVRGLLCSECNYHLEAFILNRPVPHPKLRGVSQPREEPRFIKYLQER
jgi:hypothetical protein